MVQDLVCLQVSTVKSLGLLLPENGPATQFPTPALNDWSRSRALTGHDRFNTKAEKSFKVGMLRIESNPRAEIGGSLTGSLHRRTLPSRRASTKAISVPSSPSSGERCRMN